MRFLADENVPSKLARFIVSLNHDIRSMPSSTADTGIIERANQENRVIITLDRDFEILAASFSFNAVLMRIHPPYADSLIKAFQNLLKEESLENIRGLNLLTQSGLTRVS